MRNYEDLQVWPNANLTLDIDKNTRCFSSNERLGLTSQIRRSCASIGANLAEGCGSRSDGEMGRFVQITMGSGAFAPLATRTGFGVAVEVILRDSALRLERSDAHVIFSLAKDKSAGSGGSAKS